MTSPKPLRVPGPRLAFRATRCEPNAFHAGSFQQLHDPHHSIRLGASFVRDDDRNVGVRRKRRPRGGRELVLVNRRAREAKGSVTHHVDSRLHALRRGARRDLLRGQLRLGRDPERRTRKSAANLEERRFFHSSGPTYPPRRAVEMIVAAPSDAAQMRRRYATISLTISDSQPLRATYRKPEAPRARSEKDAAPVVFAGHPAASLRLRLSHLRR